MRLIRWQPSTADRVSSHPAPGLFDRGIAHTIASLLPTAALTLIWTVATRHAWQLRATVGDYEAANGELGMLPAFRSTPLRQLHDDLVAVGADYFYPFGFGVMILLALAWIGSLIFVQSDVRGLRRGLAAVGLLVLAVQWATVASALETYVFITD